MRKGKGMMDVTVFVISDCMSALAVVSAERLVLCPPVGSHY